MTGKLYTVKPGFDKHDEGWDGEMSTLVDPGDRLMLVAVVENKNYPVKYIAMFLTRHGTLIRFNLGNSVEYAQQYLNRRFTDCQINFDL